MIRRPQRSTLFPYPTLSRSRDVARAVAGAALVIEAGDPASFSRFSPPRAVLLWPGTQRLEGDWYVQPPSSGSSPLADALAGLRSEEHTSELQSQSNLVCRLL